MLSWFLLGMMIHAFNPSTWEVEAGGLRVLSQLELHSKILLKYKK
jgi:hypothetical protein